MADTAGSVARLARLHCPTAPYFLVFSWVRDIYQDICDKWGWSWLRAQTQIITNVAKAGTCNVTFGSAIIQDIDIGIASSDVNRQFRVGQTSPIYTIVSVDTTNPAPYPFTIDQVYGATSATATAATVGDFYVTMPPDFQRFIAVLDPPNNWQLRYYVTEDELNAWDSQRSATGTPRVLASRRLATTVAQAGLIQYELWPFQLNQYCYPTYYMRRPETLSDDTVFLGPLAWNGNVILTGVLAKCAAWPGLEGKKNPYYNLTLALAKTKEYEHDIGQIENRDQEIYPTDWETQSWINRTAWAPLDAKFIQGHDSGLLGQGSGLGFELGFGSF